MHHIIPGLSPADLRLLLLCWPMTHLLMHTTRYYTIMHPLWPTPLLCLGEAAPPGGVRLFVFQTSLFRRQAGGQMQPSPASFPLRSSSNEPQQPAAPPPPAPALALPRQTFSDSNSDVWASPWLHFCFGLCGVNNAPTAGEMEEHTKEEARPEARSWIPTADQAR
ncbi:uncharacterized protein LOC116801117 isoform X1 [Drosophila sechellia]|uniref:uncharacterized protein LOC116801117 isoform X1 n=1 Tax=Drosophila sechellia TaxID=7238 RepID=UPI0013DE36AE|nr:uncharacterized protein LOC116801117 isoform X1 [Drosophila sechellia]